MKTLFIMRHAKAEGMDYSINDFDRKINETGTKRANLVAKELLKINKLPQYIVTSNAKRALQTANIIAKELNISNKNVVANENLYFKTLNDYFDTLYTMPEDYDSAMIIGHNPNVSGFVNFFLSKNFILLPTSGLVVLTSDTNNWAEFAIAYKNIQHSIFPKNLENEKFIKK